MRKSDKRSIVFLINSLNVGGAEVQLIKLAEEFLKRDFKITIISLTEKNDLSDKLDEKIQFINLRFNLLKSFIYIYNYIKKNRIGVIHAHLLKANLFSRILKMFNRNIKVVNTTHGAYLMGNRKLNPYLLYRLSKKFVDVHTAVSKESYRLLLKNKSCANDKCYFIPNGIEVIPFSKVNYKVNKIFNWVTVGRMHDVKNFIGLVQTCKILIEQGNKVSLDIIGDGEERRVIENEIKKLNVNDNITLLGYRDDVIEMLGNYNGFVISSKSEGLPMVLLEAMSIGLPIVSTDVGEIGDVLYEAKGGITVSKNDTCKLAEGMSQIMGLADTELEKISINNQNYIRNNFDIKIVVNKWENIFLEPQI